MKEYLNALDASLKDANLGDGLAFIQKMWLGFCLMGILMANSIYWTQFERLSLKAYL